MKLAIEKEESLSGKKILGQLLGNEALARKEKIPLCQDTGITLVYLEIGQEVNNIFELNHQ